MAKKQIIFLFLVILYLVIYLVFLIKDQIFQASYVMPGWHVVIENVYVFQKPFTIVYFLAIGILYGCVPFNNIPTPIFWIHVTCSLIPALWIMFWPILFPSSSFYNDRELLLEIKAANIIEQFFHFSQVSFMLFFLFLQLRNRNLAKNS